MHIKQLRGTSFSGKNIPVYLFLLVFFIISLFPLVWMLGASLKSNAEIFNTKNVIPHITEMRWDNYVRAWNQGDFGTYFLNSALISVFSTAFVIGTSSLAGYALSKFRFPGRKLLFYTFLAILMIPAHVTVVTLFHQLRGLSMLNTYRGLIMPYTSRNLPFAIFLMKGFFDTTPNELIEAARIDGATQFGAFSRVMLPVSRPILVTVTLITFMNSWQEFLYANTFISRKSMMTLSVGLTMFQGENVTEWALLFAGTSIATVPIILLFLGLQKYYLAGMTSGTLKG